MSFPSSSLNNPVVLLLAGLWIITLTLVIERLWSSWKIEKDRDEDKLESFLASFRHKPSLDLAPFKNSQDFVLRTLVQATTEIRDKKDHDAGSILAWTCQKELKQQAKGLVFMDTIITLAPLLGLLGTVTGLIQAFHLLSAPSNGLPDGVAQALIATALGLGIAALAILPFNYLRAKLEERRTELENAANRMEAALKKAGA